MWGFGFWTEEAISRCQFGPCNFDSFLVNIHYMSPKSYHSKKLCSIRMKLDGLLKKKRKILPGTTSTVIWSSSISMCYYNLTALIVPLRLCSSRRPKKKKKKKKKVFPMLFWRPTIVLHRVSTFPYAGSYFCFSYPEPLFLSSCTLLAGQLLSGASCHSQSFFFTVSMQAYTHGNIWSVLILKIKPSSVIRYLACEVLSKKLISAQHALVGWCHAQRWTHILCSKVCFQTLLLICVYGKKHTWCIKQAHTRSSKKVYMRQTCLRFSVSSVVYLRL